jgi:hypothetical protein
MKVDSKHIKSAIKILNENGIRISTGSLFERAIKTNDKISCLNMRELTRDDKLFLDIEPSDLRKATFAEDLSQMIVKANKKQSFRKIIEQLRLLNNLDFTINDNYDYETINNSYEKTIRTTSKIWEILIVLALINIDAEILYFEPPDKSPKEKKCDIIALIDGVKIGFECKMLQSDEFNSNGLLSNYKAGVEQIENSNVEKGIVVLNLSRGLPHDKYLIKTEDGSYNYFTSMTNINTLLENDINKNFSILKGSMCQVLKEIDLSTESKLHESLESLKQNHLSNPKITSLGWFNYYITTSLLFENNQFSIVSLKRLNPQGFIPPLFMHELLIAYYLNNGLHNKKRSYSLQKCFEEMRKLHSEW